MVAMKRLLMLVLWGTAGISLAGLMTAAGPATAGTTPGAGSHLDPVHVVNLHAAYEARVRHATAGNPAGIFYPEGMGNAPRRGGNGCTEPDCPVVYNEGPVQLHPQVYLLLWGPNWSSDPDQAATANELVSLYKGLGVQPDDNWSTLTSQYGDASGDPTFNGSVYGGTFYDPTTPPTGVDTAQLAAEADVYASWEGISDLADAQIVVATQSGTCPAGFYAPSVCGSDQGYYCAWHDYSNEPFVNLPYTMDAGDACGEDSVNPDGTYDGVTTAAGHEYADTITDPQPTSGWWDSDDPNNNLTNPPEYTSGEIADKCTWSENSGNVLLSTGSFALQPLWSNSSGDSGSSGGSCEMTVGSKSDVVTLNDKGNQTDYQGSVLSLSISGTSTQVNPLTWSSPDMLTGLTMNPGPGTPGVISGQVKATPGTYPVTLETSDSTGSSATVTFSWTVKPDVGKNIINQKSGLCLNDHDADITPGTELVLYTCRPTGPAERITQGSNPGALVILGQCVTDHGTGGVGALQEMEPCTGASTQEWYHNSKGEFRVQKNNLCLTDPNGSTVKDEPTILKACTGAKAQRWNWTTK
jgi:serine protease